MASKRFFSLGRRSQALSQSFAPTQDVQGKPFAFSPEKSRIPSPSSSMSLISSTSIIRSLFITSVSSSPTLLPIVLSTMNRLAHAKSPLLQPDRNPIIRYLLKKTMYAQFCAGETPKEVSRTVADLKAIGFDGVLLGYAREEVLDEEELKKLAGAGTNDKFQNAQARSELLSWAKGILKTVEMSQEGDFVTIKFTGAGNQVMLELSRNQDPSPEVDKLMNEICVLAADKGVSLCIDAEQQSLQAGIDTWALKYMQKFNATKSGQAIVYNTYQCYLKATPRILADHLHVARKEHFTLGVKLVRGAYLGSDPRHLIHDTKAETDKHYDGIAESLMRRKYGPVLKALTNIDAKATFPAINMVLAGHNRNSVSKALAIRSEQAQRGEPMVKLVYAQLQGMADDVSCDLLMTAKQRQGYEDSLDIPRTYKYLVWGTTGECTKYLLRRANENRDAVTRTKAARDALRRELGSRFKRAFGAEK